jgi:hypothetical protein
VLLECTHLACSCRSALLGSLLSYISPTFSYYYSIFILVWNISPFLLEAYRLEPAVQYICRLQRDIAGTKGIYPSLLSHHLVFPTTSRHHASRFRIPCLTAHVFSIDLVQRKLHTCRGGVLPPGASGHVSAGELGSPSCRRKETRQVRSNRHRCRHKMHGLPPQRITRPVFCIPSGTGEHVYYGF